MKKGKVINLTYQEARSFIDKSTQYGSKLGLDTMTELLNRLGNPQDKLKIIHIAGTNGKGSTAAFISSILSSEGYRVGRYLSPAVFSNRESIQISTEYITEHGVCEAIKAIKTVCEDMVKEGLNHPTTFEIETAMAMLYLSLEKVDFAVVEVGLGGRLDATNVMKHPICSVITSISLDHMQFLGDTLELIAREKAGIIKMGVPVVTSNKSQEVLTVLQQTCKKLETSLIVEDASKVTSVNYSPEGTTFTLGDQKYGIRLLGEYQISNAALAIRTAITLRDIGYPVSESAIQNGLIQARWKGRFEVIGTNPYLIIDGAHNEDAALHLKESIQLYFPNRRIIYILGVLADKDYRKILEITAPLAEVIITITPNNSRALTSSQLSKEARQYCKGKVLDAGTIPKAYQYAYEEALSEDVIIAFGSLSYLGEIQGFVTLHSDSVD